MERFIVEGGRRLEGSIRPGGNKNAALPILAGCLLTDEPVILRNLPDIQDVRVMLQILEGIGASVERLEANVVRIHAKGDINPNPDVELSKKIRASILLAGPLLARCGQVAVAKPGGDAIGRRRVDTHLLALEALGAQIEVSAHEYRMAVRELVGKKMFLDEASVTATENAIMAAVLADGDTSIYNAAAEPNVQDLCHFLNGLGAKIDGIATNSLRIQGLQALHGGEFRIASDHIEAGSYIGLAAVTRSELVVEDAVPEHMYSVDRKSTRLNSSHTVISYAVFCLKKKNQPSFSARIS